MRHGPPPAAADAAATPGPAVTGRHAAAHLELRELDLLKDSFLASVSHELRTPLSSVRGYIEVLLDEDEAANDPETVRRFLAVMQRNADRLLRLIDDLLLVARLHETAYAWTSSGSTWPSSRTRRR